MKKPPKSTYAPKRCPMCDAQFHKIESLFDHMKEAHQGRLFPNKNETNNNTDVPLV
jgi:hypothetical protein